MFGPNKRNSVSHRDTEFQSLVKDVTTKFKNLYNLDNYDILYIPGSGTLGMEVVISSLSNHITVVGPDEKFTNRWRSMVDQYGKSRKLGEILYCALETSTSEVPDIDGSIVDAISSFPRIPIKTSNKVFVTCSNKQLGASAGLSIIGVHKKWWKYFPPRSNYSYLDINNYRDNIPVTVPVEIFYQLDNNLNFDYIYNLNNQIDEVSFMLRSAIDSKYFIGDPDSPILTIDKRAIPSKVAKKYTLYGCNNNSTRYYQFFTYSGSIEQYKGLIKDLCY